jgi:pyruvate formate lyase activating enzyme
VCGTRSNQKGALVLPYYGRITALATDPIEKKPLYHFYPGITILSVGFLGCSLHCPFCQNYNISQDMSTPTNYVSPQELVSAAEKNKSFGIAYTYSEPAIHFEYVTDSAVLAHERGLKNVLVTNGYLNKEPAEQMLELMDAVNVDLKCFNDDFYRKELGGKLEPVLDFIKIAGAKTSLEVTTLIIPTKNDSEAEMEQIAGFLAGIDKNIPLHLSCYYPIYKYSIPRTDVSTIKRLAEVAKKHLNFVYLGNVGTMETNSTCPSCGQVLIRRRAYSVSKPGITDGACNKCGFKVPIPGV